MKMRFILNKNIIFALPDSIRIYHCFYSYQHLVIDLEDIIC